MLNWTGSWSDTALTRELYVLLHYLCVAADSAFSRADMAERIILPLWSDELARCLNSMSVKHFIAVVKRLRLALSI